MMVAVKVAEKVASSISHLALQRAGMLGRKKAAVKACCWVATTGVNLENNLVDRKGSHWAVKTADWTVLQ